MTITYHHDFWVAIAAASPVIALGYLVVIAVTLRVAFQLIRADAAEVKAIKEVRKQTGERRVTMTLPRGLAFSVMLALTLAGISTTLVALDGALNSLANEHDVASPRTAVQQVFGGILILLLLTAITAIGELFIKTKTGQRILRALHVEE